MKFPCSRQFLLTVLLLIGTLAAAALTSRRPAHQLLQPLESIPDEIAGWKLANTNILQPEVLKVLLPTSYLSRLYQKDGRPLDLFISYYAQQRAGESMHSPKNCLPGSGWEIWQYDSVMIPVNGQPTKINKYSIQNSGTRKLVFYWYQSKQRIIASEYLGKLLLVRDALVDGDTAGSIVRIILPDDGPATREGIDFASSVIPYVQRCFTRSQPIAASIRSLTAAVQ